MDRELTRADASLAVLAGGESSRMGRPKSELRVRGQPILEYLLDRLSWPGPLMLITAPGREHPPGHERFDAEWTDPVAGIGPLRGLLTALEHLQTPLLVAVTVDMPDIRFEPLEWLLSRLSSDPAMLAMMARRSSENGANQIEPFPIALRPAAASVIRRRLEQDRRSVHGLLDEPGFQAIPAPDDWPAQIWTNLNTPHEVLEFEKRACRENL